MTARRLASTETLETMAEIALSGVAAVCDLTGAMYLPDHRTLVVSDLHL
ncbi:MAG: metallophosphatase, partial [Allorhizobium sp.]